MREYEHAPVDGQRMCAVVRLSGQRSNVSGSTTLGSRAIAKHFRTRFRWAASTSGLGSGGRPGLGSGGRPALQDLVPAGGQHFRTRFRRVASLGRAGLSPARSRRRILSCLSLYMASSFTNALLGAPTGQLHCWRLPTSCTTVAHVALIGRDEAANVRLGSHRRVDRPRSGHGPTNQDVSGRSADSWLFPSSRRRRRSVRRRRGRAAPALHGGSRHRRRVRGRHSDQNPGARTHRQAQGTGGHRRRRRRQCGGAAAGRPPRRQRARPSPGGGAGRTGRDHHRRRHPMAGRAG